MSTKKPNIIIFLADDMGFSDLGCYGSEIDTPNIDSLAEDGVKFTQMYNCSRCCPSRASLLTGLYPHQAGVGLMVDDLKIPSYQGYLNNNCVTIAEVLKNTGYRTYLSGKWHVGGPYEADKPETWKKRGDGHPLPTDRGFDRFYGMLGGAGSYFNPPYMMSNNELIKPATSDDYYLTDDLSNHAVEMIEDHYSDEDHKEKPFFMYVSYTAPHWPLHAFEEDINKYAGKNIEGGWDKLRKDRFERLKELKIINSKWDISPRDKQVIDWEDVKEKVWEDRRMAVYSAQIDRMDQGVGKILQKLRDLDIDENTMIMFLSDNGGCAEFLAEDRAEPEPFRYHLPTWDGRDIVVGNTPEIMPGPGDTLQSYDLPWTNVSNTPFRLYKHWVHEGGISTPFIVSWPSVIKSETIIDKSCHLIDIMATCLDVAGASYPQKINGNKIIPFEGESLLKAVNGMEWSREKPLFWEHEGNRACRSGKWKLVSKYPDGWELYAMDEDRTETTDLSDKYPDIVADLSSQYENWAKRCGVHPDRLESFFSLKNGH